MRRLPQNNPEWTIARDAVLVSGFHAGITPDALAEALDCTPGSVRFRLNKLRLAVAPCADPETARPHQDDDTKTRRGDLAFKRAMLAAIKSGAEKVQACVVRGRTPTHWVRPLYGEPVSPYGSPGALAAELGEG